jgi:signal peptidase II
MRFWLGIAAAVFAADQLTKSLASHHLVYARPLPVMPHLNLTLLHNTGAAFSFLDDAAGWQRWFLSAIAVLVSTLILLWLRRLGRTQLWLPWALALILGGALGNLFDRVSLGYVVDFIEVYHRQWKFPAFNIADSAITVGAVMLIMHGTIIRKQVEPTR